MYDSIRPGKKWLDTTGKLIQAHGFSISCDEAAGEYLWIGENKEKTMPGGTVWHWGVRLYASRDFYNWESRGIIIPPTPDDLTSPLHPTYCMDRPHIIYCEKTGKYVAWLKIMGGLMSQFMTVLTADRLEGPYTMVREVYHPLDMDSGDFALAVDEETGKAYIFFERPHFELICATLTDDYTACTGEYSTHYKGRKPPLTREAPTFFVRGGKKYLITSGTTGYYPNRSTVCVFDDFHGEYRDLGDPCIGDPTNTTFNSQITSVLRLPGTDRYIACADRWMPNPLVPKMSKRIVRKFEKMFQDYVPDRTPKTDGVSGKLQRHMENTKHSRYVWLPIEWQGEKPVIRWQDEWRI